MNNIFKEDGFSSASTPSSSLTSDSTHRPIHVLVAASGSGGHLIPALHIMRAIKELSPKAVVECVGSGRPLEERIIVSAGFKRHIIKSAGLKRGGIFGAFKFIQLLPVSIWQTVRLFRRFKPDVVVGVGGYVSVLPVVIARLLRIPTWAHEAEASPGLANTVLGYFAETISVSFEETRIRGGAKLVFTGHPVRPELREIDAVSIREGAPRHLLVLGGSQGARGLDEGVPQLGEILLRRGVEVWHQCRPDSVDRVIAAYAASGVVAKVVPFIDQMEKAYRWSDLIISRAGASSVAEIGCVNRPAIFVPYPYQQGTHQSDNAAALARLGKALVVEELADGDFVGRLGVALEEILDPDRYREIKAAPLRRGDGSKVLAGGAGTAAQAIARGIIEMAAARGAAS
jgi:UDP-N-acetylglucosamine--N-acetylmuramyl-(pentapeptide) pyrophosphoryl-undecaprenol N-acetylglucosamine transferase